MMYFIVVVQVYCSQDYTIKHTYYTETIEVAKKIENQYFNTFKECSVGVDITEDVMEVIS